MKSQTRVAMLTRDFPPDIGGIATYTENLARNLRKRGLDVIVFKGDNDFRTASIPALQSMRLEGFDILHVQSLPYAGLSRFHPLVVTVHSPLLEELKYYGVVNRVKSPIAVVFEKIALMKADAVIAVSRTTAEQLRRLYGVKGDRLNFIPNGVDCDRFNPAGKSWEGHSRVLICSRLDPRKNISEAISAFGKLADETFSVDIVGDGPERPTLEKRASATGKQIYFHGRHTQKSLQDDYSKANIFVSTSHSEGFGLAVLQGMASGCAVVASDIPGHRELITSGREGLLYRDYSQLKEHLGRLISDADLAKKLGENARSKAKTFTWSKAAEATQEVYRQVSA